MDANKKLEKEVEFIIRMIVKNNKDLIAILRNKYDVYEKKDSKELKEKS